MAAVPVSMLSPRVRRISKLLLLAGLAAAATLVVGQASPPLVDLATEPLYMNGAKAKGNLTIALSVEFPTVGQTYRDDFDATKEYVGYFDPRACYRHVPGSGGIGAYFDWAGSPAGNGDCGGGGFNGNFMNWATSSAIDILRYGLTGGNRVLDEDTGNHRTVVERAWLPDNFYRSSSFFGVKRISKTVAQRMVETSLFNKITGDSLWIFNCKNRVYFSTRDDTSGGTCDRPHGTSATSNDHPFLIGSTANQTFYEVRNLVCDPNSANNRLMTYNPATKEWKGLCLRYPSGRFKPVGQFQVNSESLRVAVLGYLQDDVNTRYGGVLRSPMKYLGPRAFDQSNNLIAGTNPRAEWNATTGKFIEDPQAGDTQYGNQGYPRSGAIMYINKFGTLDPANIGNYKSFDPVSELYYEALRYLQGKQPTTQATSGVIGNVASDRTLTENFPVYRTWTDPFTGFQDSSGDGPSCLRNNILTIADVFTHADHSIPGSTRSQTGDFTRGAETTPPLDVLQWTRVVGGFESNTRVTYTDSKGRAQTTSNLSGNTVFPGLENIQNQLTGAGNGSYHIAGLAYWANTQPFHPTFPKARVKTFSIDVNENRASDSRTFRQQRQLYLAAKYGGFEDRAADQTGNPFQPGSNVLWQGSDGDAKNYFLVSDAKKFLDSLAEVFARVVEETGSIAGGAISTTRLTATESASVYQARFNPVANFWSGRLNKFPVRLAADGVTPVVGTTATWEAGDVLTDRVQADFGANRNIVIGPPLGQQGTTVPTRFVWSELPPAHQNVLNTTPEGVTDTLGELRVAWLRGDRRQELAAATPTGIFRPRDIVLGDIVNSGIVFVGKPSLNTAGADFRAFFETNKNRRPVLYVNANDGMLHAFYDDNGQEAFAYVPGFLASKLPVLPSLDYVHTSLADATPVVADAFFRGRWRTTLVSGVGGGAQGVYALDVTNPSTFDASKVLWEFTDRDHPAMGNVIGAPRILKFRVQASSSTTPTYKYVAVVANGVNNYAPDGFAHATGNPSLFFLDLGFQPSLTQGWQEGTNFWRIEIPQTDNTIAKGLVGFSSVRNGATGAVDTLYAGDMQGNLWKFDFSTLGFASLGTSAATNFSRFNTMSADAPMFSARIGSAPQPITGEPVVVNSFGGQKAVAFGTGKFLETADTVVPIGTTATFYAVMDPGTTPVSGRAVLETGSANASTGQVSVPPFTWGTTTGTKAGWYLDFDPAIAERQVSEITGVGGRILFGSIFPTRGSCGEGGGRLYAVDPLTGDGLFGESQVGVLAAPLVIPLGSLALTRSDTTGQRIATRRWGIITMGSKGVAGKSQIIDSEAASKLEENSVKGRLSWRQINNFQANKAAP